MIDKREPSEITVVMKPSKIQVFYSPDENFFRKIIVFNPIDSRGSCVI